MRRDQDEKRERDRHVRRDQDEKREGLRKKERCTSVITVFMRTFFFFGIENRCNNLSVTFFTKWFLN